MNLKELATLLGLSPTTVSRALNGYPEVNEETRARVAAAAQAHNYQPNARAIRLATGRAMAIGHVIPITNRHDIDNPIFGDFIAGAGVVYSRAGYDMLLSVVPDSEETQTYHNLKRRGAVDGVIVHAPRLNDARIRILHEIGLPYAVHGRATGTELPYSWLDVNNRRAFRTATAYLIGLGHRRIALVNGPDFMDFAIRRHTGYHEALEEVGLPTDPSLIHSDEMTESAGYRRAAQLLALPDPPTAILCASILSGIGARRAVETAGKVVGRDVSVMIYDDDLSYLRNGDGQPIFTAMRSSVREAGSLMAEMLLGLIANPDSPPVHRLLEADLVIGQTTGPGPAARS